MSESQELRDRVYNAILEARHQDGATPNAIADAAIAAVRDWDDAVLERAVRDRHLHIGINGSGGLAAPIVSIVDPKEQQKQEAHDDEDDIDDDEWQQRIHRYSWGSGFIRDGTVGATLRSQLTIALSVLQARDAEAQAIPPDGEGDEHA